MRRHERRTGFADAAGRADLYPARVAARAWRGRLESAADDVLAALEIARIVDQALAGRCRRSSRSRSSATRCSSASRGSWRPAASSRSSCSRLVIFWSSAGQTPGMRLMHLRVRSAAGGGISVLRAIVRVVGLALAIIPFFAGFIPVLFDRRRRALPDYLAGTVVVYDLPPGPP
jgi:RDD family